MSNPNAAIFPAAVATDLDLLVAADSAQTTLISSIGAGDTALRVAASRPLAVPGVVWIDGEAIVLPAAAVDNVFSGIQRGAQGTAAAAHFQGAAVNGYVAAWHHNQIAAEVKAVEAATFRQITPVFLRNPTQRPLFNSLGAGTTDVYTAPPNRRAFVASLGFFQAAGTTGSATIQMKTTGGVYWPLSPGVPTTSGAAAVTASVFFVLEPGEKLSYAVSGSGITLNIGAQILEYDATTPLFSARLMGTSTGTNVLYTAPSGVTVVPMLNNLNLGSTFEIIIFNDGINSGNSFNFYLMPPGASADTAHLLTVMTAVAANALAFSQNLLWLLPGDRIAITPGTPSAAQFAYVTLLETPNP